MTLVCNGPVGRYVKSLLGAATIVTACSVGTPASAHGSHHHHRKSSASDQSTHRHHHRSHHQRTASLPESQSEHYARIAKISAEDEALHSGSVVDAARAFQGTRYVFGGTSRSGFDCSGFVRYILGQSAGVDLPRTAMEQYINGQKIQTGDLQPGDLVFFKNTYRHGISHVGIYIGNNNFVHACNSRRGVTVDSLDEEYYVNHFAGARRVIQDREASQE